MIIFVVLGRLPLLLSESKIRPVVASGMFDNIYVFRQYSGIPIEGVKYVTLPKWIDKIRPRWASRIFRSIYEPVQLIVYALRFRPVAINAFYTLPKGPNAFVACRLAKCAFILSILGGRREIEKRYASLHRLWYRVNRWLLKRADVITTKGSADNKYLRRIGIKGDNVFVFNGSINASPPRIGFNKRDIDILFVGSLIERKGPNRTLEVIKRVRRRYPDLRAVFLGDGPLMFNISETIKVMNMEHQIELCGFVHDPIPFYRRARLLIMPSSNEGLSTAMLEAMSNGVVPIVSAVDNTTDAAKHMFNALVVEDYCDISAFADLAAATLSDSNRWNSLSRHAVATVTSKYSPSAQANDYADVIQHVLGQAIMKTKHDQ